jgi:hypothetical protein
LDSFKRIIDNKTFFYAGGELLYFEEKFHDGFMDKGLPPLNIKNKYKEKAFINNVLKKFLTLDIETRVLINNTMDPICISSYDGATYKSAYILDHLNSADMITKFINSLFEVYSKDNLVCYVHNLSNFDGVFILKHLSHFKDKLNIIYKDGKIIQIVISEIRVIKGIKVKFSLTFYDSLLLIPGSLDKLSKSFGVTNKGSFSIEMLSDPNLDLYLIREELIKYNQLDCKVLHEVLTKFRIEMYNMFRINISNNPTLSSVALKLYRSCFMNVENINITPYKTYFNIRSGYTGGHVDVYKAYGEGLYYYDVNSLYPHVMANNPYPVGNCTYYEGTRNLSDLFGIIYADIVAPDNLKVPILLTKYDKITLAPLGSWSGWYFSEELKNAVKYGYKVTPHKGYLYESDYIFKHYVEQLFNTRSTYPKTDSKNLILKLLLNSLYGRLGLVLDMMSHSISSVDSIDDLRDVEEIEDFNNGVALIGQASKKNVKALKTTVSLPVAIAVAAYARMYMSKFKVQYQDNLYYSDTDSLILDCKLPQDIIGNQLGQFKLEHLVEKGVFLGPKLYGIQVLENGIIKDIVRVKGFKNKVSFAQLLDLLTPNRDLVLNQDK